MPLRRLPIVRLVSVPHTGTRFTMAILRGLGYREGWWKKPEQGDFLHCHFYGDYDHPLIWKMGLYPAIVPLRAFESVQETWERKKKSVDELKKAWEEMATFLWRQDAYVLRVDDQKYRDSDLARIEDLLGADLSDVDFSIKIGHGQ